MAVVKIIELVGSSKTSTDDAAQTGAEPGAGHAAQHPRGRHRLDRDPRREPGRVPRPRAGRLPDRGNGHRLMSDEMQRGLPRGGAEADRGRARSWSTCAPITSGRRAGSRAPPTCRWPSWPSGPGRSTRIGPVVLYCRGGNRSTMATEALAAAGYDAVKLSEGIVGWAEAGLPLEPEGGDGGRVGRGRVDPPRPQEAASRADQALNTLIPVRFCYFPLRGGSRRPAEGAAGQGPHRHPGEPGDLRERPRPHHPDHRARVRRLRQRSREVPRRRASPRTSSSASASSRASTASASPTCRWSGSSFPSAASPRSRWRPSPAWSSSTRR